MPNRHAARPALGLSVAIRVASFTFDITLRRSLSMYQDRISSLPRKMMGSHLE